MEYKNCNKDKYLNNFTVFDHITDENNVVTLFFFFKQFYLQDDQLHYLQH